MLYDKLTLSTEAKKMGFVRDTLEKVYRLVDILSLFENNPILSNSLALKGGTAINLTIFNLPRLSVDIDFDFSNISSRPQMLHERDQINSFIKKSMETLGYNQSQKSKNYHALDSYVYDYTNTGGVKDNLKIEINYMLRKHILPLEKRAINLPWSHQPCSVLSLNPIEIFATKTVALINRSAPRDLFDIYNFQNDIKLVKNEKDLYRKCVVFYSAISSKTISEEFSYNGIKNITQQKIKTNLLPVLKTGSHFDLKTAQEKVESYLNKALKLTNNELSFLSAFENGIYQPDLLFENKDIVKRIEYHPMAIWKCHNNEPHQEKGFDLSLF